MSWQSRAAASRPKLLLSQGGGGGVACVALPGTGAVTAWLFNAGNQLPADRSRQCQKSQIAAPDKKQELGDLAWVL